MSMNFKLKNRTLLNGDIISPEIPYAVFSEDLEKSQVKRIVNLLNKGTDILYIYKQHRDNFHIANVERMIEAMEKVFSEYETIEYQIKKDSKTNL